MRPVGGKDTPLQMRRNKNRTVHCFDRNRIDEWRTYRISNFSSFESCPKVIGRDVSWLLDTVNSVKLLSPPRDPNMCKSY